ncbi:hypothetical protein KGD83_00360 [Nocardiopsis akebiae]|uniref:DUF2530 domain-containing protein n=1 Tax=Nocardiopsis akebiae TaxID=2831968 RepID=A0ABX8C3X9_9ACTN|nr:hypothetical protein [Nocardiopsis akebiae]QUX29104.1 hypothetical protein KGD83_00360 [Nocardiopsis akebiae]
MRPFLVWCNLVTGGVWAFQAVGRFALEGSTWAAWASAVAALCFGGTGLGYLLRFRRQDREDSLAARRRGNGGTPNDDGPESHRE